VTNLRFYGGLPNSRRKGSKRRRLEHESKKAEKIWEYLRDGIFWKVCQKYCMKFGKDA
jgi:hypothetical protein